MNAKFLTLLFGLILGCVGSVYAGDQNSVYLAAGIARPEGIDATFYINGGYRYKFARSWAVEPAVGYWKADNVERQCPSPACAIYDLRDLHTGVNFLYMGLFESVDLFAGAGVFAHFRERDANFPPGSDKSAPEPSDTRPAIHILGGGDVPLSSSIYLTLAMEGQFVFREDPLENQYVLTARGGLRFFFD